MVDRHLAVLQARCAQQGVVGERILALDCDIAQEDAVRNAVAAATAAWGRLDLLVNNAATVTPSTPIGDLTLAQWREALDVNLTGSWLMTREALATMRRQRSGVVLNMSSQLGHVGSPGRGAYGATKAALHALTRAITVDHAHEGIRSVSLSPGAVLTGRLVQRYGGEQQAHDALAHKYPLERLGTVDEVAQAALFLLSPRAAFIAGSDVVADGGYTSW
jgi:NAD(P)-dependent dehydrogenase (short-subunit alcohol dehydrogenase family)